MEKAEEQARRRAELIVKVRAGLMTAAEAARELGVSRKTYYKWEQRGLEGMLEGLCERSTGRPAGEPDPETEALRQKIQELEKELERNQQRDQLRELLKDATGKKE